MAFRTGYLSGAATIEHMRRASERYVEAAEPCRHCGVTGACECGQSEAVAVVEMAQALPLPTGSYAARVVTEKVTRSIPAGPFKRAQMGALAFAARDLANFYRLARKADDAAACDAVESAANAAAWKMP